MAGLMSDSHAEVASVQATDNIDAHFDDDDDEDEDDPEIGEGNLGEGNLGEDVLDEDPDEDVSVSGSEEGKSVTLQDEVSLDGAAEDIGIQDDETVSEDGRTPAEDQDDASGDEEDVASDEDDVSDEDDDYMQKLDKDVVRDHVAAVHPESAHVNYHEVLALCTVTRDAGQNVVDPLHKTIPFLTKYEYAHVVGLRAQQINAGSPPFVKVDKQIVEGHLIAQIEIRQRKVPFIICRPLPGGGTEYWRLSDLGILF